MLNKKLKYAPWHILSIRNKNFLKFSFKRTFDQFKERPKRHFMIFYKFVEEMHYKRVPYLEDHLKLIEQYEKNGTVIIGGNFILISNKLNRLIFSK
jgi:hypothetical protein